jgi:poly-beta-1,6-N-acetyl-D-glucosamine biosynthesis protein PgaD
MNDILQVPPAPLIRAKRVPPWLVARDVLLTAAAWLAIAQSMRHGLHLLYDYFSHPIFELSHAIPLDVLELWNLLKGFVLIAVCLVLWLAFWAFDGTKRLRAARRISQPAPLLINEHAKYVGVKEDELARWKAYRIATVAFDTHDRIARVSPQDPMSPVGTAT